ncbi:rhodanese-like domain-containing protein [Arcobacter sp. LA11]|uniref:rhodanese-like domain-containing protein n=1 Tax=Arcobacter sp. LA11 TaxID=1898176 RepID=UPI0009327758|nr:rhodanese-like domain-containing protein [Arcobacter sp. LA11]
MKLKGILLGLALGMTSTLLAGDFVSYKELSTKLKKENKKAGNYATTEEVKKALKSKDWLVADVRTMEEWSAAHMKGAVRVGRQASEKGVALHALNDDDKLVKPNLIVVCNSAARASIEAQTFRQMGFDKVKIYDLYSWIDECNPVVTKYTVKKDKGGMNLKFGNFYAEHCKK